MGAVGERPERILSVFSASTKKSGEDFFGESLPKKMSGSVISLDEIPKSCFQNLFQNTPYKSNFKKISPRQSMSSKDSDEGTKNKLNFEDLKNDKKIKSTIFRKLIKVI